MDTAKCSSNHSVVLPQHIMHYTKNRVIHTIVRRTICRQGKLRRDLDRSSTSSATRPVEARVPTPIAWWKPVRHEIEGALSSAFRHQGSSYGTAHDLPNYLTNQSARSVFGPRHDTDDARDIASADAIHSRRTLTRQTNFLNGR